jgi:apolipoprotein N-acyltransferase
MGALGALGFAPLFWWPLYLLSVAYLGQLFLQSSCSKLWAKSAFSFYVGQFGAGFYWIIFPFKVVGLGAIAPFGLILFVVFLACIQIMPTIVIHNILNRWTKTPSRTTAIAIFIGAVGLSEWTRGHIFSGLPWNLSAHIWNTEALMLWASVVGIFGLSILTIILGALLNGKRGWMISLILWLGLLLGGQAIKSNMKFEVNYSPQVVRLIQPSIDQSEKWSPGLFWRNFDRLLALSLLPSEKPLSLIVWPEAAVTADLTQEKSLQERIIPAVPKHGYIITGSARTAGDNLFNAMVALNGQGQVTTLFDKIKLTPFGEFMPFSKFIPFEKFTHGAKDYSSGQITPRVDIQGLPKFWSMICYEAIFPFRPREIEQDFDFILNITNDAWFGNGSGPAQHLHIVRFRAIESGRPMIRCANNGVSGVIDGAGRIISSLDLNNIGFVDEYLPQKLVAKTIYSRLGNGIFWVICLISLLVGIILSSRNCNKS